MFSPASVCPFVCLSVREITENYERILMTFWSDASWEGPKTKRLDFDGDPDITIRIREFF